MQTIPQGKSGMKRMAIRRQPADLLQQTWEKAETLVAALPTVLSRGRTAGGNGRADHLTELLVYIEGNGFPFQMKLNILWVYIFRQI